jgi:hypothetical protein
MSLKLKGHIKDPNYGKSAYKITPLQVVLVVGGLGIEMFIISCHLKEQIGDTKQGSNLSSLPNTKCFADFGQP